MNAVLKIAGLSVFAFASPALGQVFTIWAEAPEAVNPGETYTVEFWGSVDDDSWVDGTSAMAGFGIDAVASEGAGLVATNHGSVISDWAAGFGLDGTVVGADLFDVSGGQLANLFGDVYVPDLTHPILLFTFDVTVGDTVGSVTYTPEGPNINGGLSFYPDSQDGASIIAPNDSGTTLVLVGATTRIVPAPAAFGLAVFAGLAPCRRRVRSNARKGIIQ
jgi:hypothetical protein